MRLHPRIDIGEGADRARDGAGGDILARRQQPRAVATEFGMRLRQLQSEGDGFGVNTVASPDRRGQLMLPRAPLQHRQQRIDIRDQQVRGARELRRLDGAVDARRGFLAELEGSLPARLLERPRGFSSGDLAGSHRG